MATRSKKPTKNPVYRDSRTGQFVEKKTPNLSRELRSIIIEETNKSTKSSTDILKELRYG